MSNPFETLGVNSKCTQEELHRAYRNLARRWHPDRFMEGPEREWALQHMTEINAAYAECTALLKSGLPPQDSRAHLDEIQAMIHAKRFSEARRALLRSESRSARWNYLFGLVLKHQGEYEKALTYLNMAVRQAPAEDAYRAARDSVQRMTVRTPIGGLLDNLRAKRK